MKIRRRAFLAVSGLATVPLAGCFGDENGVIEGSEGFNHGTFEVMQSGSRLTTVAERGRDMEDEVALFASADAALEQLYLDNMQDDLRSDVERFIEDTTFAEERLLFVGTVGNYHEYQYVQVQSIFVRDDVLLGTFAAYADQALGDTDYNYPTALVRLHFDDEPVEEAQITVVQGSSPDRAGGGREMQHDVGVDDPTIA